MIVDRAVRYEIAGMFANAAALLTEAAESIVVLTPEDLAEVAGYRAKAVAAVRRSQAA